MHALRIDSVGYRPWFSCNYVYVYIAWLACTGLFLVSFTFFQLLSLSPDISKTWLLCAGLSPSTYPVVFIMLGYLSEEAEASEPQASTTGTGCAEAGRSDGDPAHSGRQPSRLDFSDVF